MYAPILEPVGDAKVALQSVNVEAEIENLLCEVTIKQVYSNLEKVNIEAVYTFPLPLATTGSIKAITSESLLPLMCKIASAWPVIRSRIRIPSAAPVRPNEPETVSNTSSASDFRKW